MKFEKYSAEQYRALDLDALEERRSEIASLAEDTETDAETMDALIEESKRCKAEFERRDSFAQLRNANIAAVKSGEGKVIETYEERSAKVKLPAEIDKFDTPEYRKAFMDHVCGRATMPMEMRAAVTVDGTYTSVDDYTNTYEHKVVVPQTMGREIVRKMREYGHIWPKVRKMNLKGGLWFRIWDLQLEATWITDKQVSPYQKSADADSISFSYFQLECRFAQTILAAATTWDDFQSQFVGMVAEAMVRAIESAIIAGSGSGQPLGITVDPRVRTLGKVAYVNADQVKDWKFWKTLPMKIDRLYRDRGEWLIGDTTWGVYIETLHDDVNRPIGIYSPLNESEPMKLLGRPVDTIEENILPGFDEAEDGDVIGIYGDWNNYIVNTQPGMPMSVVQWTDHETNQEKIKCLTALDGKVLDPYGWLLLVKGEGGDTGDTAQG